MWDEKPFVAELEELGESEVRAMLARGDGWATLENRRAVAHGWLQSREAARAAAASARSEARAEENLSISRRALRNSERATRIAISAITLSIFMAILAIIQWYSK